MKVDEKCVRKAYEEGCQEAKEALKTLFPSKSKGKRYLIEVALVNDSCVVYLHNSIIPRKTFPFGWEGSRRFRNYQGWGVLTPSDETRLKERLLGLGYPPFIIQAVMQEIRRVKEESCLTQ